MNFTDEQIVFLDKKLESLSKSKFRTSFKLRDKEKEIIKSKGKDIICEHAQDLIHKRLAPGVILNDGKQTPMQGHPVFIAQHATATCCRECLRKWHHIDLGRKLTPKEERFVVGLIMYWIEKNYD